MFFLADKAYRTRKVPPVIRTVWIVPPLLWLAGAAASASVALIWLAMSI